MTESLRSLRIERAGHSQVVEVVLAGRARGPRSAPSSGPRRRLSSRRSAVRAVIVRGEGRHFSDGLGLVMPSADFQEAITAFMERRPPVFEGK